MTSRFAKPIALIVMLALLAVACGADTSVDASDESSTTEAASDEETVGEPTVLSDEDDDTPDDDGDKSTTTTVEPGDPDDSESADPTTTTAAPIEFPKGIVPTRIAIPAIEVDANVIDLDIRGVPEVPEDFSEVGWYEQTRKPGELGPAVLAGHIDSETGPAVFFRLNELEPGDLVQIWSSDGEQRTFEVLDSGQYPKENLPEEVFGYGEAVAEMRLITCGGTFDRRSGHYQDNFVVYTREVGAEPF